MTARSRVSTRVQQRMTAMAMATVAKVIARITTTPEGPGDNAGTSKCRPEGYSTMRVPAAASDAITTGARFPIEYAAMTSSKA